MAKKSTGKFNKNKPANGLKKFTKKKEKIGHRRDNKRDMSQIGNRHTIKNKQDFTKKNNGNNEQNKKINSQFQNKGKNAHHSSIKGKYQTKKFQFNKQTKQKDNNKQDKTFYNDELEISNNNNNNNFFDFDSKANIFTKLKNFDLQKDNENKDSKSKSHFL